MYGECINSTGRLYYNLEIVATALQGIYTCASPDGRSSALSTGWQGLGPVCTCNNSRDFLNCDEVWPSTQLVVQPSFQEKMMRMASSMRRVMNRTR